MEREAGPKRQPARDSEHSWFQIKGGVPDFGPADTFQTMGILFGNQNSIGYINLRPYTTVALSEPPFPHPSPRVSGKAT
jgi:hypothetical protein